MMFVHLHVHGACPCPCFMSMLNVHVSVHVHAAHHRCVCVFVFVCINAGMPDSPASDQSGTGIKKLTMPGQVWYRIKPRQSSIFLVRYRTELSDAGMPMPALVSWMPMPSYAYTPPYIATEMTPSRDCFPCGIAHLYRFLKEHLSFWFPRNSHNFFGSLHTCVSSNNYNCVTSWNSFENLPYSVLFPNERMIIYFLLLLSHGMHFLWRVSSWSSINFPLTHGTICHCLDSLDNKFLFLCDELFLYGTTRVSFRCGLLSPGTNTFYVKDPV